MFGGPETAIGSISFPYKIFHNLRLFAKFVLRYRNFVFINALRIISYVFYTTNLWCNKMAEKPKGDWTANEAKEYTKNCIFK